MQLRLITILLATLLAPALTLSVRVASAATLSPAEEADQLMKRANALRQAGDDEHALPLFQRAYQLLPGPRTAAQLGLVEQALFRWVDADEHLTEALKAPDTDPFIKKHRYTIELSLKTVKKQVSRVEINGEPEGAEALVNGRMVGKVPLQQAVRVNAGSVDVELRAPGYRPVMRTIVLTGGQYQSIVIRLQKEGSAVTRGAEGPVEGALEAAAGPAPGSNWRKWTIASAVGGAALGLGLGAYGVLRHNSKIDSFHAAGCLERNGMGTKGGMADTGCADRYNAFQDARKLAIVGFSVAGGLAATALILYVTAPDARDADADYAYRRTPACLPDLVGRGVSCALRF